MFQNNAQVKRNNANIIKKAMKLKGTATKNDIMKITGLSFATCSNLINEMVKTGEIEVCSEMLPNGTGRPSYAYQLNTEFKVILAIFAEQLDGTKWIRTIISDLYGEVIEERSEKCEVMNYEKIRNLIGKIIEKYSNIGVIGISVQGVVSRDGVVILCDTSELEGENLAQKLERDFSVCAVCENDMNVIAYGVSQWEELSEDGSVAAIAKYKGLPSGSGLVLEGRILHGSTNFAGEVSFIPKEENCSDIDNLVKEMISIISVINPGIIAIVGDISLKENLSVIKEKIGKVIPAVHCPEIIYLDEPFAYARKGLMELALKKMEDE